MIICPERPSVELPENTNFVQFPGATATDDSGLPPTITYTTSAPGVQVFPSGTNVIAVNVQPGTILVTATARDNNGNMAECTIILTITSMTGMSMIYH